MHPSKIAIQNPASVFILIILVTVMGIMSYLTIPREASPDIQIPILIVTIPFPGASPEDVESLITFKTELELQNIENLNKIKSVSSEGACSITLEFTMDFDIDQARNKVREALDKIRPELPTDIEEPIITEINLSEQPLLLINLSGEVGLVKLKDVAEKMKDVIESIPGILEVRRIGGLEKEVRVYVDPGKLQYYNLNLNQISSTIQRENASLPGGTITIGPSKYLIRVPGEFTDPAEIKDLVITAPNQVPILVKDVANVTFGFKEITSRSRLNGVESVSLSVSKRSGENLMTIRDKIKTIVTDFGKKYQNQITFAILSDHGKFVQHLIRDLENNIITGFIFVFAVLFLVMGIRNALLVATAVPLSFLMSMLVLEWLGFTLNFIVLFSLILALGMLVDNAIVVVENIFRHRHAGKGKIEAAIQGVVEVAIPITTSTLTTVVAFAPIIFMPGISGQFMGYLPKTLIITLTCSLVVGLIINPVLSSTMMNIKGGEKEEVDEIEQVERSFFLLVYKRFLLKMLANRGKVILGSIGLFFFVLTLYAVTTLKKHGVEFFPVTEPKEALINITAPQGSTLDLSDKYVIQIENDIQPDIDSLDSLVANVGQRRGFGSASGGSTTTHLSHVIMAFPTWDEWNLRPSVMIEKIREKIKVITGAEVQISQAKMGPPTGPPINIEIRGDDFATSLTIAEDIKRRIKGIPGLVNLKDDFDRNRPEIRVLIDREKIARLGLRTQDIASTIRTAFNGRKVSKYRDGKDEYDIIVRLMEKYRSNPRDLETLYIPTPMGTMVSLSELAKVETGPAYGSIRHVKLDRVITVSGDASGSPGPVILAKVQATLKDIKLPEGYSLSFTGENEDRKEMQQYLIKSFYIAIFLIFLVLVTQFNSIAVPFIILSSVILSLIGVFLGLMIHGNPFSIMMTGIGTISLAGIVVNNAIVLIDFIRQLRNRGMERDKAIVLAGMVRMRPVLLTAITTVLGLLPIAIGMDIDFYRWPPILFGAEGGSFWKPMAIAVIYGLSISTVLTLVVVPVLYSSVESTKEYMTQKLTGKEAIQS